MARASVNGIDYWNKQIQQMDRQNLKRIVMAGAAAAGDWMKERIVAYNHVGKTGDMLNSVGPGEYRESLGGGSVDVYPLGTDRKGAENRVKAEVASFGRGGRPGPKSRDFFLVKDADMEERVRAAMQAESDRIMTEIGGG